MLHDDSLGFRALIDALSADNQTESCIFIGQENNASLFPTRDFLGSLFDHLISEYKVK
jgi:hypothetical protein